MTPAVDEPSGSAGLRDRSPLLHSVRVLRERWWVLAVCMIVCAAGSYALASRTTKQYTATAQLLVQPSTLPALINGTQSPALDSASLALQQSNDVSLATSVPVSNLAKSLLRTTESAGDLASQVTASAQSANELIDLSAVDNDPARAARIANAFATALVSFLNSSATANLLASQNRIQTQLSALPAGSAERASLEGALRQVVALRAVTDG